MGTTIIAGLSRTRRLEFQDGWPRVKRLGFALAALVAVGVPGAMAAAAHTIALFPSASSPHWAGFARVINHSGESGTVRITGIDDAGREHGPVEFTLEAWAAAHFNSGDLEEGNAGKGLSDRLGDGEGDWRLRLESELAVEVLSYIRTGDGFVTAMHEGVPAQGRRRHVRFFNPGSNGSQVSRLRLVNPTGDEVEVTIEGRDDEGEPAPGGEVRLTLGVGEAREVSAQALESGGDGLVGSLGDGMGKWQLFVSADAAIEVMSLLESPTGHLSNLSGPGLRDPSGGRRELELALFMPASDDVRQGVARLLNHSEASGTVRIYGIDDEGQWSGPVVLTLAPGAAAHVNSSDLERGNAAKGLAGALGSGSGSWRLRLYTGLDLEALAYVRTSDGFVTTMHERVRERAMRHHVAFFNPGSNASQVSSLRLINPTEDEVEVRITGRDDEGESAPGGEVRLTLGAGEARMLTAQALESGGDGLVGTLGDGTGKWQLFVSADAAIEVMNLLGSPTGHLANLSASSQAGVVDEGGIDEPVALDVIVDLPPEVTSVRASDLETTVLGAEGEGVPPGGAPALLVASDAGGAVLYALVDEDGGLLGEEAGTVRVSVASTAVVVVALAAGYRIPSVTPEAVEAILSHAEFGALTRKLVRLMGEDKNYLVRLSDYADVVAVIQRMAGSLAGAGGAALARSGFTAADAALLARAKRSAGDAARSVLPEGNVKADFYCTPLTGWPCSPWDAHEPWRWFGDASGVDLTEAVRPPFLARSEAEGSRAVHASANPSFVGYAMELYEGSQHRGWSYVPGNATVLDKLRNSGAAYREFIGGDGRLFGPDIDRIRFQRYRLALAADGDRLVDHAAVAGFLTTAQLLVSIANVVLDFGAMEEWLIEIATDASLQDEVAACARSVTALPAAAIDPNTTVVEQGLAFSRQTAPGLFRALGAGPCRPLIVAYGAQGLEKLVVGQTVDAVLRALVGVGPLLELANDAVPSAVSYFAPGAARSEYYIEWDETPGGQAYIARVSQRPLPVAAFTYAQQRGFRAELDASESEGEGLRYEWRVAGRRIGTGRTLEHDFRAANTFDVTLTVRDRNGVTAEEHGRVRVTAGRVPEVRALTCTPTGEGTAFTMLAELSDADDDIETVEWFSTVSNPRPDRVTGADQASVTLSAPVDATYTRAKVRVVDARGNETERNCPVEFDPAPPVPRISDVSAEEGEALEFTVTLDREPSEVVTYYYATYRASARDAGYVGHVATSLHFARGERSKALTVHTTEDARVERDETFYVYITESTGDLPFEGLPVRYLARAAGTILDDDETGEAAPVPRIADASAEEGEALEFTVTLEREPSEAVTYYYATYRGTAGSGDYAGHDTTALSFRAGQTARTITVRTTEDARVERDETFYVYITESTGDLPFEGLPVRYLARAAGTILDDDETGEAAPVPRIADASAEEGEALEFTVTLEREPSEAVTYYYATYRGTAGSGDYAGHDTTALSFRAGQTARTITVRTIDDTEAAEGDERFYIYITDARSKLPDNGYPADYLARATGTIRDNDEPVPTPSISNRSAEEGESIEFTVRLDRTPSSSVTYYYATYRGTAGSADYAGHDTAALSFRAGQTSRTITVHTTEDTEVERDETFYVYITESTGDLPFEGLPVRYLARAAGTILDDDETGEAAPVPRIADASAEEGESIEFTVTLDRTPSSSVTYYYATYRGTAGRADYTGHDTAALSFRAGQTSRTITVHTTEDTEVEGDETFYVFLTDASSKHPSSGSPNDYLDWATGTIRDDDEAAPPTPRISNRSAEEGESIEFTVTLDRTPSSSVTYYYATYRGTAGSADYAGHDTAALSFRAGQTSRTITVHTTEDTEVEGDERFHVYVTDAAGKHPENGVPTNYLARATGTILDDDELSAPPKITEIAFYNSPANGNTYKFGESIEVVVRFDRWVRYSGDRNFEAVLTIGAHIRRASFCLEVPCSGGGDGFIVRYLVQASDRDTDGISIAANALRLNGGTLKAIDGVTDAALTHDAVPDDSTRKVDGGDTGYAPTPSISNRSAEEGESIEFTVTLDRTPSSSVTYYYATYRGTAGRADYTGHDTAALSFRAGQTSRTITVHTTEDTEVEGDETFYVFLTDASSKHPSSGSPNDYLDWATGTIRDDDEAAPPTPRISNRSAEEGESIEFTVTLDRTPSSSVTYYYATYRGTAGSADYTGHDTAALSFRAGQTSRTITVHTTEDTEVEGDETFYVFLTDASSKHPSSGSPNDYLDWATGTIRDDDEAAPTPRISNRSAEEGESIEFTVTLDRTPSSSVTYYYATYRGTAGRADYTGHDTAALSFRAGQTSRTITVHTTEDTEVEGDETFYVFLTDASSKHPSSGSPNDYLDWATGTIRDDDTVAAEPDLVVSSASLGDSTVEQGDRVRVDATVRNQGNGSAGSSRVGYYISKVGTNRVTRVDDDSVSSLMPGRSDSEYDYIETDDLEPGSYFVLIKADYDGRVTESNENNNTYSGTNFYFTVAAPALPDLVVSSASLGDTTVEQGDRIRISATVKNQGSGRAGSSRVAYYWGSGDTLLTRVGDDSVSSLSAGESNDEYINADTDDLAPGTYFVLISADFENDVNESDETNNIYSNINFRFTVTAP